VNVMRDVMRNVSPAKDLEMLNNNVPEQHNLQWLLSCPNSVLYKLKRLAYPNRILQHDLDFRHEQKTDNHPRGSGANQEHVHSGRAH
jgi:hypothetical protein